MQLNKNHASNKSEALVGKVLNKLEGLNKARRNFMISIITLFLSMRGRYNFKGISRYGNYNEMTYHNQFEKPFDFLAFNFELCRHYFKGEKLLAFDPSFLPKSGKKTPHRGNYWSGCLGKAAKGLEIGGLAVISVEDNTALHLQATQTISRAELNKRNETFVDFYAQVVIEAAPKVSFLSKYLLVDGYFTKKKFINPVIAQTNFHLIGKLNKNPNLKYLYTGERRKGSGRPKQYDGKVQVGNIDKKRFKLVHEDEGVKLYQNICWSVNLKRPINVVYAEFLNKGKSTTRYALFYSTDLELNGLLLFQYYKARFQIEFLFRDAKQHTGLAHCQSTNAKKMDFHYNASLTAVNIGKAAHYLSLPKHARKGFSLADIKTLYFNELMIELILSKLEIDPTLIKNTDAIPELLSFGKIAA